MMSAVSERIRDAEQVQGRFFSGYEWCLNPILRLRDIFRHLDEELHRYDSLATLWERQESITNMYIFACAVSCTVDDYLSWRPWVLNSLRDNYEKFGDAIDIAEKGLNTPRAISSFFRKRKAQSWIAGWDKYVELVCRLIIYERDLVPDEIEKLVYDFNILNSARLPEELMDWRMKLNDGFRCQDLTHYDVLTMGERFLEANDKKDEKVVIIGSRTAGSYFAPLLKVHLELNGFEHVDWMTLRPKAGVSRREKERLRRYLQEDARVLLTDDYSNTGYTFKLLQNIVKSFGVGPDRIVLLAPIHPAKPDGDLSLSDQTQVITITNADLHKTRLMSPELALPVIRELLAAPDIEGISVIDSPRLKEINGDFERRCGDNFQVRLKHLYELRIQYEDGGFAFKKVLAKSVGWGWLGYHAYFTGTRLSDFVPQFAGLRDGIMFMEWVDGEPLHEGDVSEETLARMVAYLNRRTERLGLDEDPRLDYPVIGWGWLQALRILRRAYGPRIGYIKNSSLMEQLSRSSCQTPVLTDGRMRPGEWLATKKGLLKVDFEQHNFGAPEFDVVDPAYDLAITSFEFHLARETEEKMIRDYSRSSGDSTVFDRIILFKLLYGTIEMERSLHGLLHRKAGSDPEYLNRRNIWSWNYLVFTMNNFCAGLIKAASVSDGKAKLFFMDLDGVFDSEVLGFAHTSTSGIKALSLLGNGGYSVVPNTGRSIVHVKNYCSSYGFSGGIAEYGSVIYDAAGDHEISLADAEGMEELDRLRAFIKRSQDIFTDYTYRYAVRAYRYGPDGTEGLTKEEAAGILKAAHLNKLKIVIRQADTYFIAKNVDKGLALTRYLEHFQSDVEEAGAIGDSDEDIPMLKAAAKAFAPENGSAGIKSLAAEGGCSIVSGNRQHGLLSAAERLLGGANHDSAALIVEPVSADAVHRMILELLTISELSRTKRLLSLFNRGRRFSARLPHNN